MTSRPTQELRSARAHESRTGIPLLARQLPKAAKQGKLPAYIPPGKVRPLYRDADVDAYIKRNTRKVRAARPETRARARALAKKLGR